MVRTRNVYFFTKNKREEINMSYRKTESERQKEKNQRVEMAPQTARAFFPLALHVEIENTRIIKRE